MLRLARLGLADGRRAGRVDGRTAGRPERTSHEAAGAGRAGEPFFAEDGKPQKRVRPRKEWLDEWVGERVGEPVAA